MLYIERGQKVAFGSVYDLWKKGKIVLRLHRLGLLLTITLLVLVGCQGGGSNDDDPPPDPVELLIESADNIRSAETFRLEVRHSGADYFVSAYLVDDLLPVNVAFRRAIAQYVFPDALQASVRVLLAGAAVSLEIFSRGDDQWFKLAGTDWVDGDFAPGFNPRTLIAEDTGFQAALASLTDLDYIGTTTLEDGTGVFHLRGTANGQDVTALLVGLIEAEGLVPVDVYIDRDNRYPVRLVITQPETDPDDPTTWTIDVYDINAEPQLAPPSES